jgi:hypothetical protein
MSAMSTLLLGGQHLVSSHFCTATFASSSSGRPLSGSMSSKFPHIARLQRDASQPSPYDGRSRMATASLSASLNPLSLQAASSNPRASPASLQAQNVDLHPQDSPDTTPVLDEQAPKLGRRRIRASIVALYRRVCYRSATTVEGDELVGVDGRHWTEL